MKKKVTDTHLWRMETGRSPWACSQAPRDQERGRKNLGLGAVPVPALWRLLSWVVVLSQSCRHTRFLGTVGGAVQTL